MNSSAEFARGLLVKARGDGYVLARLADDESAPQWILGFHAQQAVEKALKAVLALHQLEFPRTHNLSMLLEILRRAGVTPPPEGDALDQLIPFGVALRYGDIADDDALVFDRVWAVYAVETTIPLGKPGD